MGDFSELELQILLHCRHLGYRYATINDGHVRVMKTSTKPVLVGNMYRVDRENGTSYFGETLFVPGLFEKRGNDLIDLNELSLQESFFVKPMMRHKG